MPLTQLLTKFQKTAENTAFCFISLILLNATELQSAPARKPKSAESPKTAESPRNIGIGLGVGSLSGISGYYLLNSERFAQGLLWFSSKKIALTADCNVLVPNFLDNFYGIHAFYGVGGIVDTKEGIGARIPLGALWKHEKHPLQFSAEVVPGLFIIPETHGILDFTLNLRYILKPKNKREICNLTPRGTKGGIRTD